MMKHHRIERIETVGDRVHVYLEDGSQIDGIISAKTSASVNSLSTVKLQAYIYKPTCTYQHYKSKERVTLTSAEEASFFRNRNPFEWKRIYG
jgi:predicted transposase YdaD